MKMKRRIVIIDYEVGNHQSVINALEALHYDFLVSCKAADILAADAFILPGVGAFHEAMRNLKSRGLISLLGHEVLEKRKPILGICVGMQVLAGSSTEDGFHQGLGWIPGKVVKLQETRSRKVPHVGWSDLEIVKPGPLFRGMRERAIFYFDHSYNFECGREFVAANCRDDSMITAAVQKDHIFGLQFHPEKSQIAGLKVLRNYLQFARDYNARRAVPADV